MMDNNANIKRVSDPKPILGATLVRISKDPARSSKELVFKSSKESSKSGTIDPSRRSSYPSLSNVHPERTSKEFTKIVKEPRSSQDPLRSSSKVPVRPSEEHAKVRDERGRELLVKSLKKPTPPMGIKDFPKLTDDNRRESLLFKSVKKPEMMGTKGAQIPKDGIRRDSLIKSANNLPMTSGAKDPPRLKNDNGNISSPKTVAKQEITANRDTFKVKDDKGRETSSKSFLKPHASGLKDVREVKREEGKDVLSTSVSKQPMSAVKDSSRPKGDGGRDLPMKTEKKPQVFGSKDLTKERDGTGRDPLIKSEMKPQQVVSSKGLVKGIDGTVRDPSIKSEMKPQQIVGFKGSIKGIDGTVRDPSIKSETKPHQVVGSKGSIKGIDGTGRDPSAKSEKKPQVIGIKDSKAKDDSRKIKVVTIVKQSPGVKQNDMPVRTVLKTDSPTLKTTSKVMNGGSPASKGTTIRKVVTKSTVKSKEEKRTKKVFSLPGQRFEAPEERDALRLFYASLHSQIPESEMANIWMMEHGLLPADEAKWVLSRKQSSKGSMPLKPAAYKPSPSKVSNGRPAGNKPPQKLGTGQNVDMKPLGKKRKEEGADEKLPPVKKLKM